jgi:hypothetical protein
VGFLPFLLGANILEALLLLRRFPTTETAAPDLAATPAVIESRS